MLREIQAVRRELREHVERSTKLEHVTADGFVSFGVLLEEVNENVRAVARLVSGHEPAPVFKLHTNEEDED